MTDAMQSVILSEAIRSDDADRCPAAWQAESDSVSIESAHAWASSKRSELIDQARVHGAVLFRGLPVTEPEHFDAFLSAFDLANFPYEDSLSNAVRVNFTPRVFSANEAPSDVRIYLHHEMAQTPIYPEKLFFCCLQAAESGGATPICRSDWLVDRIREELPEFYSDCKSKGLRYSNVMPNDDDPDSGMGRSWRSTLRSDTVEAAEERLRSMAYDWTWLEGDCLRATTPVLPAIKTLPDGRETFFNQLIAAFCGWSDERNDPSNAITFGDGTRLPRDTVLRVGELAEEVTYDLAWQDGDIAMVDNQVVMHGRRTFTGKRRVLASLAEARENRFVA